jgi:predicted transcriptional regulator
VDFARIGELGSPPEIISLLLGAVTADYLVCLEDGHKFKTLKRHLKADHGLTPASYRAKWNLPNEYPMVAPGYAKARSELAKRLGLGQKRRGTKGFGDHLHHLLHKRPGEIG